MKFTLNFKVQANEYQLKRCSSLVFQTPTQEGIDRLKKLINPDSNYWMMWGHTVEVGGPY